ncbi:MAG: MFS transporter [Pseudoflavonifractor sp.]
MNTLKNATPSLLRLDMHYIAMQIGYWAMFAGICAYQAALLQGRGFSNSDVGILIAVRCFAGIVSQPLLGGFADRHPNVPLKLIVSLSLVLSLGASLLLMLPMGLWGTIGVFVILGGFELSAYPLMDSMAIQFINAGIKIRYSLGRGIGSMAFAVTCAVLGWQVAAAGVESTLITHAVLVAAVILLVATFPAYRAAPLPHGETAEQPQSVLSLLRSNPRFTLMLVAILLGLTACMPMSNFMVNIVESRGGTSSDLGLALFLMGAFELPTAFLFSRLLGRFGSGRLLVMSMFFMGLKAIALMFAFNYLGVLAAQPLQMLGYGLFTPASVYFVNESVPPADRVRGQTIMMVASNGLGGMMGGAVAGQVLDLGGVDMMLAVCIALGIAATLLGAGALRVRKPK